ncbi:MAG: HlyD family efflux transporter periplasmic adaptor subunit [Planctomycetes bacterium]|nr:HlyD family efflux transporter periplasmic adaptor subunit [Planctomycetota bacterium]
MRYVVTEKQCIGILIVLLLVGVVGCVDYEVEVSGPERGLIEVSFREPAVTWLENKYLITMPVNGRIERVKLIPGDKVRAGELLVAFDRVPLEQALAEAEALLLEYKTGARPEEIIQAEAVVEGAQALVDELARGARVQEIEAARTGLEWAQAEADYAVKEFERMQGLYKEGAGTDQSLQAADSANKVARAALRDAEAQLSLILEGPRVEAKQRAATALKQAQAALELVKKGPRAEEIARVEAQVISASHYLSLADIWSPIDGVVLEKYDDGDRTLPAGQPLLLLGNLDELEVEAEVLSQDALRLEAGGPVRLEMGFGKEAIEGKVKRIEPAGFMKLSSLGVEQQRVNVIISFEEERPAELGVDYRIHARFITGSKQGALVVPRFSVLQDTEGSYYVLKVVEGVLQKAVVTLGMRNDLQIEIVEGLAEGDVIVKAPDTTMKGGEKVKVEG